MRTFLGIDPGLNGGIAFVSARHARVFPMPKTERDIYDLIASCQVHYALIEQAQARPGQSKTHIFFQNYGFIRGVLVALGIPYENVSAFAWQRGIGVPPTRRATKKKTSGKKKTQSKKALRQAAQAAARRKREHKNKLKQKAQGLFPALKITLATADALLIAEFARRSQLGVEEPKRERVRL